MSVEIGTWLIEISCSPVLMVAWCTSACRCTRPSVLPYPPNIQAEWFDSTARLWPHLWNDCALSEATLVLVGTAHPNSSLIARNSCSTRCTLLMNRVLRSEEHTSELQSQMRSSYAVFCLKQKISNVFTER